MREIHFTTRFKKDYKRLQTQPRLLQRLHTAIDLLQRGQPLDRKYCDHALTGDWNGHRECHVTPDWLLIYRLDDEMLILDRTGSHADLFG
jgi:mRNA interferase YafQ